MTTLQEFDYVQEYIDKVNSKEIKVSQSIQRLIERHQNDLERDFEFEYDLEEPQRVIKFLELLPDLKTAKPTKLASFQKFIISLIYGWRNKENHTRRFRDVFITMARKQGKSVLISGICLYELIYSENPKLDRQVFSSATTAQQARIVFGMISKQLAKIREKSKSIRMNTKINQNIITYKNEGFIRPLSSNTSSLDGYNPLIAVIDEYAYQNLNSELMSVLQTGMSLQDNPLLVKISTAGTNQDSIMLQQELPYARKVLSGKLQNEATERYLPIIYEHDDINELEDESNFIKSNPLLEVEAVRETSLPFLKAQLLTYKEMKDTNILVKSFNSWQTKTDTDALLDMTKWNSLSCEELEINKPNIQKRPVYIGVDLSMRYDLTSVSWAIPIEEEKKFYIDSYSFIGFDTDIVAKEKNEKIPYRQYERLGFCEVTTKESGLVDLMRVVRWIKNFIEENELDLKGIYFDAYGAQTFQTELEEIYGDLLVSVRQGYLTLSSAIADFRKRVAEDEVYHNDNPLLNICLTNSELVEQNNAFMIRKKDKKFTKKIDASSALLNVFVELQHYKFDAPVFDINDYFDDFDISL